MTIRTKLTGFALAAAVAALSLAGAHAASPVAVDLAAPTNLAPFDGATANLPVTLDWLSVSGATSYQVRVRDLASGQITTFDRPAIANSYGIAFAVIPNGYLLEYGHTYVWDVQACINIGCGPYSTATEFTVTGYPGSPSQNPYGPQLQTATIPANSTFDFRTGQSVAGSGDIYFSTVIGASYKGVSVYTPNDWLSDFGVVSFDSVTLPLLQQSLYSNSGFVDNKNGPADLVPGDVFAVQLGGVQPGPVQPGTSSGPIAKVQVISATYSELTIQYEVFN